MHGPGGNGFSRGVLAEAPPYTAVLLTLDEAKLRALWNRLVPFRTLFSDLTRGDFENFVRAATNVDSLWIEVLRGDESVGLVTLEDLHKIVDVEAHLVFFDKAMHDKIPICRAIIRYLFDTFPLNRISVTLSVRYFATMRLVTKGLGFRVEGKKRAAVLINKRWHDQFICGLLRSEAYGASSEHP